MARRLFPLLGALALLWASLITPAAAESERRVSIVYTGFTGGLSSGSVPFSELFPLFRAEGELEVGTVSQDAAFRHGDHFVFTAQGPLTLADFQAFLAAGPFEVEPAGTAPVIRTDHAHVLQAVPGEAPWLTDWLYSAMREDGAYPEVGRAPHRLYHVLNRAGVRLTLMSPDAPPGPAVLESPSRWEMVPARAVRITRDGRSTPLLAIGRPLGDGLRRAQLLRSVQEAQATGALTVDVGNMVDPGVSALSVEQRAFTLLQLGTLGYDAVVPAEVELSLPPADWERLASTVPVVAANLVANAPGLAAPPGVLRREVEGLDLALVGLVDDQVTTRHGVAGPQARWRVTDPLEALDEVIARLAPERPDALIVLTNIRGARLQSLRHVQGVTAVIGDFEGLPGEVYQESVSLSGAARRSTQTAHLIARSSPSRVGVLEAVFEVAPDTRPVLRSLLGTAHLVTDQLPTDPAWRHQLDVMIDRYQAERRGLLLPDLRDLTAIHPIARPDTDALPALDEALWSRLVAALTRQATGAEVAVLPRAPVPGVTLGPVSRLTVESWLELGDRLVQTTLSGEALKKLAAADSASHVLAFSGLDADNGKVLGASLLDGELYRVTTTDRVVRHARFESFFAGRERAERWLRHPEGWARPYAEGERTAMRTLALAALEGLKARHGGHFGPAYMHELAGLLAPADQVADTRWTLRLEDGQLLVNSYQAHNNGPFSEVRNTRVTTPSSFALGGKGRLVSVYESKDLAWENRAKAVYKRSTLRQDGVEVTQETDDEVVLTSEFRFKRFQLPVISALLAPLPFVNSNYVTQLTPDENEGQLKPRRAELNAVSGLVFYPGFGLKEVRAGGVLKNDLANPGFLEPGFQVQALVEQKLDPWLPGTFKAGLDVTQYLPTPTDTPDRLGLLADLTAGLTIPVWERLHLSVSADYFLFRGKVPSTMQFGSSLDFKVGIGYALGFKPFYGLWY